MSNEVIEKKKVKLVYFGKKYPKIIQTVQPERYVQAKEEDRRKSQLATKTSAEHIGVSFIPLSGPILTYKFMPFKEIAVVEEVAKVLLANAGDIFKNVSEEPSSPDPKPVVKTNGHVGDIPADKIKDLDKTVKAEMKAEEGKSVEQIIDESKSKK